MTTTAQSLPLPPQFPNSDVSIPPFLRFQHPYTKWMINMIRSGSHFRLTTMIRERPELFQQIFQIPDLPGILGRDERDNQSMFHKNAVLYVNPLCLAIYLKDDKSVDIILRSGVNHTYSKCYATDVFSRGVTGGDIIEVLPVCVAIRREFYESLPLLTSIVPPFIKEGHQLVLDISKPFELHYESKTNKRLFKYRDVLHYATETMKKRLSINISSLLETLITIRPDIWQPQSLESDGYGQKISLFRRVARVAYYDDSECRKSHNLVSALETLFRNRCFVELQPTPETKTGFEARIQSLDPMILDQDCSIALLMGLYYRMHCKTKNIPMNQLADLINRALFATKWRKTFLRLPVEHLQKIFSCLPENVALPSDSLLAIKTHVSIINEREQENEINLNMNKIPASEMRSDQDDCSLLRGRSQKNNKPPSLNSYVQASSSMMNGQVMSGRSGEESESLMTSEAYSNTLAMNSRHSKSGYDSQPFQAESSIGGVSDVDRQMLDRMQQMHGRSFPGKSPNESESYLDDLNSFDKEVLNHMLAAGGSSDFAKDLQVDETNLMAEASQRMGDSTTPRALPRKTAKNDFLEQAFFGGINNA